ncbi:MAG: hypothetical protein KF683_01435, partial [Rubrivivax sp.]|nr:hypothetical protein [Rubrivivax sp.]
NVLSDAAVAGVVVDPGFSGGVVELNTILRCPNGANLQNTNTVFRSNFVSTSGGYGVRTTATTATVNSNVYSGAGSWVWNSTAYTDFAAWQAASSQDAASQLLADPGVGAEGRPLPGSPLLTGGADLGYLRDRNGILCRRFVGAYGAGSMAVVP